MWPFGAVGSLVEEDVRAPVAEWSLELSSLWVAAFVWA